MTNANRPSAVGAVHPLHAILLSFPFPLFTGALVGDIAYWKTHQIEWSNLAQWLNAGGLAVGAFALLWAFVAAIRAPRAAGAKRWLYVLALALALGAGLLNALVHSKDAWAIMPDALWWSGLSTVLALVASWLGFARPFSVETF